MIALPVALVSYVRSSVAQDCPFDSTDAVPDTLDPRGYLPLAVGNLWEYVVMDGAFLDDPRREEVVADTLIEGSTYYKLEVTFFDYEPMQPITRSATFLRYMAVVDSGITRWHGSSTSFEDLRFDLAFNSCYMASGTSLTSVSGGFLQQYTIDEPDGDRILVLPAIKEFDLSVRFDVYGHGVGLLTTVGDPSVRAELSFANVDGMQIGTPLDSLFTISVNSVREPVSIEGAYHLRGYPNPFDDTVHITFSVARRGTVSLHVVDILGRIIAVPIREKYLTAGSYEVMWRPQSASSSAYLLRLSLDGKPVALSSIARIR